MAEQVGGEDRLHIEPSRRAMVAGGVALVGIASAPFWLGSLFGGKDGEPATERQRRVLAIVADIVVPATATPGGAATGTGAFVELALAHGLDGTRDPGTAAAIPGAALVPFQLWGLHILEEVVAQLDSRAGGDFLQINRPTQIKVVTALDAAAFAPGGETHPWHKIKDLILTGYYTSEAGGSQELAYELVPGRWDPNVALADQPRAYSSDWTAVDFG